MKHCPECKTDKPLGMFSKNSSRHEGLQGQCKECRSARRKADYIRKRDSEVATNSKWRKSNPEKVKAIAKKHRQSPHGAVACNTRNAVRRAAKLNATPTWLTEEQHEQIKLLYAHAKECEMLTGDKYHVDHIVPLQGENVSGLHVPWNLQVLPADINIAKSNNYGTETFGSTS